MTRIACRRGPPRAPQARRPAERPSIERGLIRSEHRLVESGVYRWIRHPIHAGGLALDSWGWLMIVPLTIAVARRAAGEEAKLAGALAGYREYCARSWRSVRLSIALPGDRVAALS